MIRKWTSKTACLVGSMALAACSSDGSDRAGNGGSGGVGNAASGGVGNAASGGVGNAASGGVGNAASGGVGNGASGGVGGSGEAGGPGSGGAAGSGNTGGTATGGTAGSGGATTGGAATCDPDAADAVETALRLGDPRCVRLAPVRSALLADIEASDAANCALVSGMFAGGAVDYAPGNRTQLVESARLATAPILTGVDGNALAVAGSRQGTRLAAFGSVPPTYFQAGENLAFEEPFTRLLEWLITGDSAAATARAAGHSVATAHLHGSDGSDTRDWLASALPAWTATDCNDRGDLAACFADAELLIVGWDERSAGAQAVTSAVESALAAGTAVLYLHSWYEATGPLSDELSALLGFELPYGGNYWADDRASWSGVSSDPATGEMGCGAQGLSTLLRHLQAEDYAFDWSQCDDDVACEAVPGLVSEFYDGARAVQRTAARLEQAGLDPFSLSDDFRLEKLAILLGDKYREGVAYPLEKGVVPDSQLLGALFADHAALVTRRINPAQPDLGSFSPTVRADYPVEDVTRTVATRGVDFVTSTRVYALPGRTVTVTRSDASEAAVSVRVNYLRDGTSHIFGDHPYDRPAFLWGNPVPLVAGQPVQITSPYGGILFLDVSRAPDLSAVTVELDGVARHPVYEGPGTETAFADALATTELGWAEIATPALEIHSRMDLMLETVRNPEWNADVATLVDWTWKYLYQDVWGLAGFVGTDLEQPATITAYCAARGWDCTSIETHGMQYIQHANLDRALAAYGTSGNPYDAWWAFSPLGWGDAHEIGHNLQRDRLKIDGDASTEVSNNIFPVHSRWHFTRDAVGQSYGNELDFPGVYAMLQAAQRSGNTAATMRSSLWVNGGLFQRLIFYWQLAMNNAAVAHLGDEGWDVFRLLYLAERELDRAVQDDAAWLAARDNLGFAGWSRQAAADVTGNDFMLIATSFLTGRDHRAFFEAWGVVSSAAATAQVASFGLPAAPRSYWVIPDESAFTDPLPTPLPIDGTTAWPY